MAPALRPEPKRFTFVRRVDGVTPKLHCFVCNAVMRSNARVSEGAGSIECTAKLDWTTAGRHSSMMCGALYWLVAGVRFPWGGAGVLVVRTTKPELSRIEAAGLSVEQQFDHFTSTPFPGDR